LMLSDVSIKTTVAPAELVSLAALPPEKNGRVKASTIKRIARQRKNSRNRLWSVRRRMVRCGTCLTKTRAGNWTLRARVRRTRCTSIGAARAATPNKNNGFRNDILHFGIRNSEFGIRNLCYPNRPKFIDLNSMTQLDYSKIRNPKSQIPNHLHFPARLDRYLNSAKSNGCFVVIIS